MVEHNRQMSDVASALGYRVRDQRLKEYYDTWIAPFAAAKHGGTYPLGPLGLKCSQHSPTPRPSVERICSTTPRCVHICWPHVNDELLPGLVVSQHPSPPTPSLPVHASTLPLSPRRSAPIWDSAPVDCCEIPRFVHICWPHGQTRAPAPLTRSL